MKIGVLGTRGIPNQYGGFEQFAEYLSEGLVKRGHEVWVYNSHNHSYQEKTWQGVNLIHCYDPEDKVGTAGQFIYDFNCIRDSRKRKFDILLQLGYTSSSVWSFLLPSSSLILTNMDGLEWKRSKYSAKVQRFLRWAEKRAVDSSDVLIADSVGIQDYLITAHGKNSHYIPYGAHQFKDPNQELINSFGVVPDEYDMLIARMEPENNIETILDGVAAAGQSTPVLVIGNSKNSFGQYLEKKFVGIKTIRFCGPVYNHLLLDNLRYFCRYYFHGHSVGGTNPSLLEAMASKTCIIANSNEFNRAILGEDAFFFSSSSEVAGLLNQGIDQERRKECQQLNFDKIANKYTWGQIIDQYESLFISSVKNRT